MSHAAWVSDGTNRLSGERIRFWIKGNRKMICEPNALLEIVDNSTLSVEGVASPKTNETTDIWANKVIFDEAKRMVEFDGNVRVRDSRVAMNCGKVTLYLKESNEIDWIEAHSDVIIQSDERKALADEACYYADEGKFVLTGSPKVKMGAHVMMGDRITFWQKDRRMLCEPNARVLLYLDQETREKFQKDLKN
jgi:lipopolysaccharide transport protein LptA